MNYIHILIYDRLFSTVEPEIRISEVLLYVYSNHFGTSNQSMVHFSN